MKRKFRNISSILVFWVTACPVAANNIQVSDVQLESQNPVEDTVRIQFDLSWENSWRTTQEPGNWDAAWVFAKYRVGSGAWKHARLEEEGHRNPVGGEIITVADKTGVFLQRSGSGAGAVTFNDVGLRWDYGIDGVVSNSSIEVRVFAIEMVYVPQGAFKAGDPDGNATNGFYFQSLGTFGNPAVPRPYGVSSDGPISYGTFFGLRYGNENGRGGDQMGPIPETYPLGFDAFYCMKYEVTQGQWVDFFNSLTPAQKAVHDVTGEDGKNTDGIIGRNAVSWSGSGSATTTLSDVSMSFVGHENITAYLDWSGLRMMSEFEYEKACRGPEEVVPGEFAWGSAEIHATVYNFTNQGLSSESITNPGAMTGNACYLSTSGLIDGPARVGIFAGSAVVKSREETGASYYGIMELSGNLYERCVTVGTPQGRAFEPNQGDGSLTAAGAANVSSWPGAGDSSYRGGAFINSPEVLKVGDRTDGSNATDINNRRVGFRGVRSAPLMP